MKSSNTKWSFSCFGLIVLSACGGGGGGGDDGEGWISVTSPARDGYYLTASAQHSLNLGGRVFDSPHGDIVSTVNSCVGLGCIINGSGTTHSVTISRVKVGVVNKTIGLEVTARKDGPDWESSIALTLGDNHLRVWADDARGNRGEDDIVVHVPVPPYILPQQDISVKTLSGHGNSKHPSIAGHDIAANANGDAVVAWLERDQVYAASFRHGEGWSERKMLSDQKYKVSSHPQVAIDGKGRTLVVWHQGILGAKGCNQPLAYSHKCAISRAYKPGKGWSGRSQIPLVSSQNTRDSHFVMDQNGRALFYWFRYDGSWIEGLAAFDFSNGWFDASETYTAFWGVKRDAHFIPDNNGGAMVVWQQYEDAIPRIYFSRYSPITGWEPKVLLGQGTLGGSIGDFRYKDPRPRIALSSSGNAVVAWTRKFGDDRHQVMANYFNPVTQWSGPTSIESQHGGDAYHASVGIDAGGNALVIWQQENGADGEIRANAYVPGAGWGADYVISSGKSGEVMQSALAMTACGDTTAVWLKHDGWAHSVVASKYSATMEWGPARLVELDKAEGAEQPRVDIVGGNKALIVWNQFPDTWNPASAMSRITAGVY